MMRGMTAIDKEVARSRYYAQFTDFLDEQIDHTNLQKAAKSGPESVPDRIAWVAFCERADINPAFDPAA